MPDNHRGMPLNGNHRPTPRIAKKIATLRTQENKEFFGPNTPETSPASAQRYVDDYRDLRNSKETYGMLPVPSNDALAQMQSNISRSLKTNNGASVTHSQDTDVAPAQGIPRPNFDFTSGPVVDGPNDYDLGSADAEDLREQSELSNERMKKGHY